MAIGRTFTGTPGQPSTSTGGPLELSTDIDAVMNAVNQLAENKLGMSIDIDGNVDDTTKTIIYLTELASIVAGESGSSKVGYEGPIPSSETIKQAIDYMWGIGIIGSSVPSDNSVSTEKIQDQAVTTDKIQDASVTIDKVSDIIKSLYSNKSYPNTGTADALIVNTDGEVDYTKTNWNVTITASENNTGAVTLNVDGQGIKDVKKIEDGLPVDLEADDLTELNDFTVRWSEENDFFLLAPSGANGSTVWLQQYDGANAVLLNDKGKDIEVKAGEFIYDEFYRTKIQGDGSHLLPNPDVNTWDETLSYPSGDWYYAISIGTNIYARNGASPYNLWKYDTLTDTWDETLSSPSGIWNYATSVGTDVYVMNAISPYNVWKYDTLTDTWDETLSSPSGSWVSPTSIGTNIYVRNSVSPYNVWKYDTLTDTWDETLSNPSNYWPDATSIGTDIYVPNPLSPYDIWKYDTLTDTWDETLSNPSGRWFSPTSVGTNIYVRNEVSPYNIWKYDTLTDTWDETLSNPSGVWDYPTSIGTNIYVRNAVSPYNVWKYDLTEQIDYQVIPPTTQAQIIGADIALLHMDGTAGSTNFIDESGNIWTANGNVQIDTSESKFSGASALFDGVGDWIDRQNGDDLNFDDKDFTIDMWIKRNTIGTLQYFMGDRNSSVTTDFSIELDFQTDNTIRGQIRDVSTQYEVNSVSVITDTSFHHLAFVRDRNTLRLFIDGNEEDKTNITGVTVNKTSNKFALGRFGEFASNYFNGHIDEFHLVTGEAKWTTSFTSPTQPYVYNAGEVNLKAILNGTLEMFRPKLDQVHQGFKSKINLWDVGMENANKNFSNIKSTQYGVRFISTTEFSVDITISEVDMNKSIVRVTGDTVNSNYGDRIKFTVKFIDNTTIRLTRYGSGSSSSGNIQWEVVEFYDVKSKQTGSYSFGASLTAQISITPVDTAKSILYAARKVNYTSVASDFNMGYTLSSPTIILLEKISTVISYTVEWQLLEFN